MNVGKMSSLRFEVETMLPHNASTFVGEKRVDEKWKEFPLTYSARSI